MKVETKITKILSEPVSKRLDGSTNGLELKAIGIYTLPSKLKETDIFIFILNEWESEHTNYVIIPASDLRDRMEYNNFLNIGTFQIKLWLTDDGRVFEMHHRSTEFEIMGMYTDTSRNWTEYLDSWEVVKKGCKTQVLN